MKELSTDQMIFPRTQSRTEEELGEAPSISGWNIILQVRLSCVYQTKMSCSKNLLVKKKKGCCTQSEKQAETWRRISREKLASKLRKKAVYIK